MKQIRDSDDQLLTRAEVAEIFQVAPSTVTRWAEAGKLPSVKTLGGHRRYQATIINNLAHQLSQEEASMQKTSISVPAMYGDHHVLEVRGILLAMPGIEEVNASSCFHTIEVVYDPTKVSDDEIRARLGEAGYLDELAVPVETGTAVSQEAQRDKDIFFRHTTAYTQARETVSFGQNVGYAGRPLWPCPGMGIIEQSTAQEVIDG
jgi:excisionase family DNA binding protein